MSSHGHTESSDPEWRGPPFRIHSSRQQPRTVLICVAFAISASASTALMSFPRCALTSWMNAATVPHAAAVSLACTLASAVCSFASNEILVPAFADRFVTMATRSASCSAAPFTWTVKLHDDWLPDGSCAVLVTGVVPIANTLPDAGADETVAEQLSPVSGANATVTPDGPVASTVIGAGHAITGASTSFTVTVNEHEGESPSALCAFEVTCVVPTSK